MINVALMQYSVAPTREETYKKIQSLIAESNSSIDYLILPELFSTPYFCQKQDTSFFGLAQGLDGGDIQFLMKLSQEQNIFISTTIFEARLNGTFANTAVTINNQGQVVSTYRKSHIPQDPCFEEKFYFQPGSKLPDIVHINEHRVSTAVCWDQWFPELARCQALKGASLVNYPTAIAWLEGEEDDFELQMNSWLTVTRSHAIANGLFISCTNRVGQEDKLLFWGQSHLTAPSGKALIEFDSKEEGLKVCAVDPKMISEARAAWPFLRDRRPELYSKIIEQD